MAVTKFIEPGGSATLGFEFWTAQDNGATGLVSIDTQAIFGSFRSIKATSGSGNDWSDTYIDGVLADAGRRISFGFRYTGTIPSRVNIATLLNLGGGTICASIGINSAGKLVLLNDAGTVLATGSSVLSTSTDYRISMAYTVTSTTVNTFTIYLGGSAEIIATNVTLNNTGAGALIFGVGNLGYLVGANISIWGAHFYIDDGTSGDPGNIRATAKRPFSNGTTNGMTASGSAGAYGTGNARYVNERPIATANFVSVVAAGSAITEEYNIEGLSVGDNDLTGATIVDYTGWLYAKALLSETGKIIVNNVQTNISLVNANTMFTKIAASSTYPAGTGTDIGIVTATTATTVSLFEAGIMVAYIPATATTTPRLRSLLGVGL